MGNSSYSLNSRNLRAATEGYATKGRDEIFKQNVERKVHPEMSPLGIAFRECCDSVTHPNTVPIILSLDLTASMGHIPHELIKTGLPHIMGNIIQRGVHDAAMLFVGIGDHECDKYPLQVGQFESGDAELDLWLTRTYIESGGGGNAGESYLLAWYFAANHTKIDSFSKRGVKGFLFTIGDEPCLKTLPASVVKEITGDSSQKTFTDSELLEEAQRQYHVFHLHLTHSSGAERSLGYWKQLLGSNCIEVKNHADVSMVITETILKHQTKGVPAPAPETPGDVKPPKKEEIIL